MRILVVASYNKGRFAPFIVEQAEALKKQGCTIDYYAFIPLNPRSSKTSQKVFDETVCEFIVPVSTAIQNARTIPSIKEIGSYASNGGNGVGYLEYEGVHLQEGLPCQIAAYTFVLSLLGLYGFVESINGESTHLSPSILVHLKPSLPKNPFFNRLKRDST